MESADKILPYIRRNGPIVPAQINKHLGVDVLFASAMLSELADKKQLKLSKLKVGGSPLYFIPGQEKDLARFAHKLSEKDKRTHDLLAEKKVLAENEVDPLVRVSLRQIPDFAVPLEVDHEGKTILIWKYFTVDQEEAASLIKKKLGIQEEKEENKIDEAPIEEAVKKATKKVETLTDDMREQIKEELRKKMNVKEAEKRVRAENKVEKVKPTVEKPKPQAKKVAKKQEDQTQLVEEEYVEPEDDFYDQIKEYFSQHKITIISSTIIRKASDIDLSILLPTAMGEVSYYCKARAKKKINDGDLSAAFIQGQIEKKPVLFLTTGDITKKGLALAEKEFTTMIIKQIENGS